MSQCLLYYIYRVYIVFICVFFSFHNHGRCHTCIFKIIHPTMTGLLIRMHVYVNCVCRLLRFFLEKIRAKLLVFTFTFSSFLESYFYFIPSSFFTKYFYFYSSSFEINYLYSQVPKKLLASTLTFAHDNPFLESQTNPTFKCPAFRGNSSVTFGGWRVSFLEKSITMVY